MKSKSVKKSQQVSVIDFSFRNVELREEKQQEEVEEEEERL